MKVTCDKPKGQRMYKCIKYKHTKVGKTKRPFWIEPTDTNIWFDYNTLEWIKNPKSFGGLTTSYYSMRHSGLKDAYSLKAVKRLIKKWKYPKGTVFRASLPFVGYDFYIKG